MRKNLCFRNDGSESSGILTMNLKVSGNTIIYLLTKRYTLQETIKCGSVIGVDDEELHQKLNQMIPTQKDTVKGSNGRMMILAKIQLQLE